MKRLLQPVTVLLIVITTGSLGFSAYTIRRELAGAKVHRMEMCRAQIDTRQVLSAFLEAGAENFLALAKTKEERLRIIYQVSQLQLALDEPTGCPQDEEFDLGRGP